MKARGAQIPWTSLRNHALSWLEEKAPISGRPATNLGRGRAWEAVGTGGRAARRARHGLLGCLRGGVATHVIAQRRALEKLHRVPRQTFLDASVQDRRDARVPDAAQRADLATHAREPFFARNADGFQRDDLTGLVVYRPVDDPRAALAEPLQQAIGPEGPFRLLLPLSSHQVQDGAHPTRRRLGRSRRPSGRQTPATRDGLAGLRNQEDAERIPRLAVFLWALKDCVVISLVPETRLELVSPFGRRILSPLRIPFRHSGGGVIPRGY